MATLLDGRKVNAEIIAELKPRVAALAAQGRPPGLAVVLVGNDPGSEIYVRNKVKTCESLGIFSEKITPPDTITTAGLLELIGCLNQRPEIDGILVQMPLPAQVDSRRILLAIDPAKDVDGFHPYNTGLLVANAPGPRPCTPAGIMELLRRYEIPIAGQRAVVVGRSDIVGKPMALMLLHQHATVTVCHSKTRNLVDECRRADILVGAIGRAAFLGEDAIREGAVVIDVGMNRVTARAEAARILRDDPAGLANFDKKGHLLTGDIDPVAAGRKASFYTPVPGGVGPLTIAMLMVNTVASAEQRAA